MGVQQRIAVGKNQIVMAVLETNTNTTDLLQRMAVPTAYAENNYNFLLTSGEGSINQELEVLDDKQLREGRSKKTPISGRYNPGKFSFPTYIKTSPLNGTSNLKAHEQDVLLRCLMGTRTAIANPSVSTKVSYSLIKGQLPSFTLYIKKDHTVFIGIGATVNSGKFDIKGSDVGSITWDGEFMCMLKAGTSSLTVDAEPLDTTVTVDANTNVLFDEGAYVEFVNLAGVKDNNGNQGYKITDITGDVITVSPALVASAPIGSIIQGFIPFTDGVGLTPHKELVDSLPIHGKRGLILIRPRTYAVGEVPINIEANSLVALDASFTITNGVQYSSDEKNGSFYAKEYFNSDFRAVEGTFNLYFRVNDAKYWKHALSQDKFEVYIPVGDSSITGGAVVTVTKLGAGYEGKGFVVHFPHVEFKSPTIAGENEITQTVNFTALGTPSGMDDEVDIHLV